MDGITEAGYQAKAQLKLLSSEDKKDASSKEEKKPLQLAISRVMNKVQKLIYLQRTASNAEELELLFAGLSM